MPHLQDLWSEVSSARNDVLFLAVNVGDSREQIAQWWREAGFTLEPVRQQEDEVSRAFGVRSYPTNFVLGPDGRVLWRGVGWGETQVGGIREALESTAAAR